ncbi:MAG: trypsin-like peptidase domain-containing protein [Thermoguttaceae bacterium]
MNPQFPRTRLRHNLSARTLLAAVLLAAATSSRAQISIDAISPQDPRRTPTVEIFHRWKDSVVYLTGPLVTGKGPSMDEFFRLPQNRETSSIGSGFVIHESGYIVANAHSVERVIQQFVNLGDGQTYPAELIAVARDKDLALLKVEPGAPLRPVQLAKSGDFLIGERVTVIGNPHGLRHTCTAGIVSAAGRSVQTTGLPGITLHDLIQTDAGLNPGSSGGPWFNVLGRVIGITTSMQAGSQAIGFAVPVAALREVLPDMLDVERRYGLAVGLELLPMEPCTVAGVAPGSPAAAAGIQSGDILQKLNGKPLDGRCDFHLALVGHRPGDRLQLELWRKDRVLNGLLVLAARAKPDGAALLQQRYGLTAVPLNEAKAHATALRVYRGVIITAVAAGTPYEKLQSPPLPGDVLARINDIRPRNLDHVGLLLDRIKPHEPVHFVLLRMKDHVATRIDITVTLEK